LTCGYCSNPLDDTGGSALDTATWRRVLTEAEAGELMQAHKFQRHVENHYQLIEEWSGREISRESPVLDRLARSLGYPGRQAFLSAWERTSGHVRGLFGKFY
jgi:glutamine synthetase adenylyltransferase